MPRFDLNLLTALDALLNDLNVTHAAARLKVTQPTMSGMLQRLRYQFDDPLLVKIGRNMTLTPYGKSLIAPVREALSGIKALARVERGFDQNTSTQHFSIMASDYSRLTLLPRVIAKLSQCAPHVHLTVLALDSPARSLLSDEADFCLSSDRALTSADLADASIESSRVLSDRCVCVVNRNHELDEHSTVAKYQRYSYAAVQAVGDVESAGAPHKLQYPATAPEYLVPDFSLIPPMVACSNIVGLVPKRLADMAARSLEIRSFTPAFQLPTFTETLMWHRRRSNDAAHSWLHRLLVKEAECIDVKAPVQSPTKIADILQTPRGRLMPRCSLSA
jgi:DNA-binding transcriptional LysR family regulator